MKKTALLIVAIVIYSCASKKMDMPDYAVYKLASEKDLAFSYRSFDVYYIFFPDGKLKTAEISKNQKLVTQKLRDPSGTDGAYYKIGRKPTVELHPYDLKKNKNIRTRYFFTVRNDSLFQDDGKIFVKVNL